MVARLTDLMAYTCLSPGPLASPFSRFLPTISLDILGERSSTHTPKTSQALTCASVTICLQVTLWLSCGPSKATAPCQPTQPAPQLRPPSSSSVLDPCSSPGATPLRHSRLSTTATSLSHTDVPASSQEKGLPHLHSSDGHP